MNWYQNLYFGKNAEERREQIIQKIEEDGNPFMIYLITLAPTEENQMEIITPSNYRRQAKRKGAPLILGLACGMREAKQVTLEIVEQVYRQSGTADVRGFFERR